MGEATHRVNGGESPDAPRAIEGEIDAVRADLDRLVGELARRRREALDWRLQVRRHRREIAWGAAGVALLWLGMRALRRRR